MERVEAGKPRRVVIGSFSEIRFLAEEVLPYRRQVHALLHFFVDRACTILILECLSAGGDVDLQSLAHRVIRHEQLSVPYGGERRRLRTGKMRGRAFRGDYHGFVIRQGESPSSRASLRPTIRQPQSSMRR